MTKTVGVMLLVMGMSQYAVAALVTTVPEINPESALAALTLLSGALLVLRGRQRK